MELAKGCVILHHLLRYRSGTKWVQIPSNHTSLWCDAHKNWPKDKPVFYILAPFWFARLSCFQLFCYSPKWELVCTLILSIISGSVIKNFKIFCRYCRASQWNQRIEKRAAVNRGRNRYLFTYSKSSILINLTLTLQPPWIVNWWLWMTWIGIRSGNWRRTSEPNNVKRMKLKTK